MSIKKLIRKVVPYSIRLLLNPFKKFLFHSHYRRRALYTKIREQTQVDSHMILYEAYHGESMTGNPYAVFIYLLDHPEYQHFKHVWVVVNDKKVPPFIAAHPHVNLVKYQSPQYAKYLATAKYLINDTTFPFYFHKRKEQIYANIWHGTPLKKMGMDIHKRGFADHKNVQRNFLFTDYFVSPNQYTYETLLKSHDIDTLFNGHILDTGYPRIDLMYWANKEEMRQRFGIDPKQKIILYAPTWRGTLAGKENQSEQILKDVKDIQANQTNAVVLLKAHYYTESFFTKQGLGHLIVPNSQDTNELLAIVDVLITDYSSIFFDFLPTERPILFYAYDEATYQTQRGTYIPMDELPGPLCDTIQDVLYALNHVDKIKVRYHDVYQRFLQCFCYHDDGQATERFIQTVFAKEPSDDFFKIGTDRTKILIYGGGFLNNGITASVVNLLNTIDYQKFDVTLIDHGSRIKKSKEFHMRKINGHVHHLFRFGTWNATFGEFYRHVFFLMTGWQKLAPARMYEKEMERLIGLTEFDIGIDFGGYSPLWSALFAYGPFKRKSIYLHSDMSQELDKKVNNHYPHRKNLQAIFALYNQFDKVISVSERAHQENRKNLMQHVRDERKMDYVVNPIDYEWILHMKDWVGLRSYEGVQLEMAEEFAGTGYERESPRLNTRFSPMAEVSFPAHDGAPSLFPLPSRQDTNFITIGRLSPEKDHKKLINAFAQVVKKHLHVKLYIVGEGVLGEQLKEFVEFTGLKHHVFFTGQLDNPYYLLNQCDCFVLSSNYEGQAIVLLESLILGKPIITTDIPGPRAIAENGHGRIVNNSVAGLVQGMDDFLNRRWMPVHPFDYKEYQDKAMAMFYDKVCQWEDGE